MSLKIGLIGGGTVGGGVVELLRRISNPAITVSRNILALIETKNKSTTIQNGTPHNKTFKISLQTQPTG
jgi:homoserine dehydrogenase